VVVHPSLRKSIITETLPTEAVIENGKARDPDGGRIEAGADEIFEQADEAVREAAEQASRLAHDTLERGRSSVKRAEWARREGSEALRSSRQGLSHLHRPRAAPAPVATGWRLTR
jgi:hypothetical protein